jgi:transposase-like protein
MSSCLRCSSSNLTHDGRDERGRVVFACGDCGRHATIESGSLVSGHRFPREVILLTVRYYLQLGVAAERIAGVLADRGVDVSGRTILGQRWVQKFGPALSEEIRSSRKPVGTTWLVDETYVKILGKWQPVPRHRPWWQVLDCWLSRNRDLAAAEAFFRRTISSTGCTPEHNRCERNHGYVKSRIRPMRGLKSFSCATRLFPALDALQLVERDFVRVPTIGVPCAGGRSYVRALSIATVITRLGQAW